MTSDLVLSALMLDNLAELFVGFILTTVCGALLGYFFQRRHARYQWLQKRWEKELDACQTVFEEISHLLGRRLYRSRQLADWIKSDRADDLKLQACREIMTQWNDNMSGRY